MKATFALVALAAVIALPASASADATIVKKAFAAASVTNVNLQGTGQTLSADLTAPRKNKILVVNAMAMQDAASASQSISLHVDVNGVRMEPGYVTNHCEKGTCAVSSTFFLNMADAESANPGLFYNKLPMTIEVTGNSTSAGNGKVSFTAELIRRR